MIETIKRNPVPAALAGLSIGWLFMNRANGSPSQTTYPAYRAGRMPSSPPAYRAGSGSVPHAAGSSTHDSGRSTVGELTEKVGDAASRAQERAGQAVSSAGDFAGEALGDAGELTGEALSSAGELASSAGGTAADAGATLLETIKQNPIPATLVGVGLGWLFMNRSASGRAPYTAHSGDHRWRGPDGRGAYETGHGSFSSGGGVGDMARQARDQAGEVASGVQEQAGEVAEVALRQAYQAPDRVQRMVQDNPLMAGALAIAVGSAVGLALPETTWEARTLGETRDKLMGQAETMTHEAMEKAQRVAEQVQQVAKTEAREQGLTV